MNNKLFTTFLIFLFFGLPPLSAQPRRSDFTPRGYTVDINARSRRRPPPLGVTPPETIPIDGGISLLLLGGIGMGSCAFFNNSKHNSKA
ncbi:MAG: hypothetical protein MI784_05035 [Cytophagales bacterium]|nr:hypothetical protein [Cytophagales bacterium]